MIRLVLLAYLLLGLNLLNSRAQPAWTALQQRLQYQLDSIVGTGTYPGATLAVRLPGGELISLAAGWADQELQRPMPQGARMLAGSTGKTFVSALILQLIAEDKLQLTDRIADFFDQEPWFQELPNAEELTVGCLLNHTSGLPRYIFQESFLSAVQREPGKYWSPAACLAHLRGLAAIHPTGKGWSYSDSNYLLLGLILEKITGDQYYRQLQERILQRLNLDNTSPSTQAELPGLIPGYIGDQNFFELPRKTVVKGRYIMNPQFEWTGGGVVTNVEDLAIWIWHLHAGDVLGASQRKKLVEPVDFKTGAPSDSGYGLGSFVWLSDLGYFYGHAGMMPGYLTQVEYSRQYQFGIAFQTNTDQGLGRDLHSYIQAFSRSIIAFLKLPDTSLQGDVAIRNVRIIDVEQGNVTDAPQDVILENGRIAAIAPSGQKPLAKDLIAIDATGKYLIPGLWDMHVHPDDPEVWRMQPVADERDLLMPQFVLHGVVGVRDMAGSLEVVKNWRKQRKERKWPIPEIIAAGPLLDGPNPMWDGSIGINSPANAPQIIDSLIKTGIDFLKVYSLLPRDIYFALSDYANKINFPFVGHVPFTVAPSEAARSGMKSQEHLLEILLECSDRAADFRNNKIDYPPAASGLERYLFRNRLLLDTFDEEKWKELIRIFRENRTWHTPTLSMWYKNAYFEIELQKDQHLYSYLPSYLRKYWTVEENDHLKHRDNPDLIQLKKELYRFYLKMVRDLNEAGVGLLCGTDMGANPLCFPGIGVHNELEQMVKAGLSPADALRTATLNPARFLAQESQFGTVQVGKKAELVLLDDNPLEDINNVRLIYTIIHDGKIINTTTRTEMLENIKARLE